MSEFQERRPAAGRHIRDLTTSDVSLMKQQLVAQGLIVEDRLLCAFVLKCRRRIKKQESKAAFRESKPRLGNVCVDALESVRYWDRWITRPSVLEEGQEDGSAGKEP